jgi:hypothetical protein
MKRMVIFLFVLGCVIVMLVLMTTASAGQRVGGGGVAREAPDGLAEASRRYVKPAARGDCSSWSDACELETALGKAAAGDKIWVTEGHYTPKGSLAVTDFTFAAWVDWRVAGGWWQRIFDFGHDMEHFMMLTVNYNPENKVLFQMMNGGERLNLFTNLNWPNNWGTWDHIAVTLKCTTNCQSDMPTYDGAIYLNGVNVTDYDRSSTITIHPYSVVGPNNWLGKSQYNDADFYGKIDEVAVFQRALSQDQITDIISGGWDGMDGLVLGLHLDENPVKDGDTLNDASGLENHAALKTDNGLANKSVAGHTGQATGRTRSPSSAAIFSEMT